MKNIFTFPHLLLPLAFLVLATFMVYAPALRSGFVNLDDEVMVVNNPLVRGLSKENIVAILTRPHAGLYHPLVTLSYALEYQVFGMKPAVFHATNIGLHIANCLLAFCLAMMLFKDGLAAFVTAFLFAVHPLHVESVAWISERKDMLSGFFYLSSLIAYVRYCGSGRSFWYTASVCLCAGSLLSKPMALSLPLALLLIDLVQERKDIKKLLFEKIPYLVLVLAFGVVALGSHYTDPNTASAVGFSFVHNALNAAFNLVFYIYKTLYPEYLSAFYPYSTKFPSGITALHFVAVALLAVLGFFLVSLYRRSRSAAFGLIFFLIVILPVLQFVPVGQELPADRYTYLPLWGIFLTAGIVFARFYRSGIAGARVIAPLFLAVITVMLAQSAHTQVRVWQDSLTLWNNTIKYYPSAFAAYRFRAEAYQSIKNYPAAFADLATALRLRPGYAEAYNTRGNLHADLREYDGAIADYSSAITAAPAYPAAYYNRAVAFAATGNHDHALADYRQAIALNPGDVQAHNNLGVLYARAGNFPDALRSFSIAIQIDPHFAAARQNRARISLLLGHIQAATNDVAPVEKHSFIEEKAAIKERLQMRKFQTEKSMREQ